MEPRTFYGIFTTKNGHITGQLHSDFIYSDKAEAEGRCSKLQKYNGEVLGDATFGYAVGPLKLI